MEYVATNPNTKMTFRAAAENKDAFLLLLVKKAPHIAGWYPDEIKECVEKDMIEEDTP
jgi:hypothetical protein